MIIHSSGERTHTHTHERDRNFRLDCNAMQKQILNWSEIYCATCSRRPSWIEKRDQKNRVRSSIKVGVQPASAAHAGECCQFNAVSDASRGFGTPWLPARAFIENKWKNERNERTILFIGGGNSDGVSKQRCMWRACAQPCPRTHFHSPFITILKKRKKKQSAHSSHEPPKTKVLSFGFNLFLPIFYFRGQLWFTGTRKCAWPNVHSLDLPLRRQQRRWWSLLIWVIYSLSRICRSAPAWQIRYDLLWEIFNLWAILGNDGEQEATDGSAELNFTLLRQRSPRELCDCILYLSFHAQSLSRWIQIQMNPQLQLTICNVRWEEAGSARRTVPIPTKWFVFLSLESLRCAWAYQCTWANNRNELMASFVLNESHGQASHHEWEEKYFIYRSMFKANKCASNCSVGQATLTNNAITMCSAEAIFCL